MASKPDDWTKELEADLATLASDMWGTPSTHLILQDELTALRRLQREQEPKSPFVFTSGRGLPSAPAQPLSLGS
jgi:hypothetical protein